ncbi:hypothetical protein C8T65DRAFT_741709 [Cerioporus squamosus]|nr:hypothetical protein C8T65DRAFT_741709 [Cerioporus squamosus]
MSSDVDSDSAAAATVALFDNLYTGSYCTVVAAALFFYDTLITSDREVACFWTAKWTGGSLLFFANKWISMMVYVLLGPVGYAPFQSDKVLYGYQFSGVNFPLVGCLGTTNATAAFDHRFGPFILVARVVVIASRVPLIAADALIIYITWTTLYSWVALRDFHQSKRISLLDVLFRGGTIYFVVLFILNALHLVLSVTAIASSGTSGGSIVTQFTGPLTAIIISRFLLELKEADQTVVNLDPHDSSHPSRNQYDRTTSFISSLGGFVNPALSAQSNDDSFELRVRSRSEAPGKPEGDRGQADSESPQASASSSSSSSSA